LPVNQFLFTQKRVKRYVRNVGVLYPGRWRLDWPAMEDRGDDVLGNLPRTRPGRRSEKRDGRQAPVASRQKAKPPPPESGGDPVGDAVRAAAGVAEAGIRVANGITRELLRRLPRP
jgi:hypothetical protein